MRTHITGHVQCLWLREAVCFVLASGMIGEAGNLAWAKGWAGASRRAIRGMLRRAIATTRGINR
jgi:hypothetical protein